MKSRILSKVSHIPVLVEYTFTTEEENDIDKFQMRKCINFKRMVLEGLRDGDTVGITVPAAYDDIMV
ncbi:hypothetical protein EON65_39320 [archaeon]|nr:MAG: hypothetical protein EON65_39320 [archaeon]